MIASLSGNILSIGEDFLVVNVGGIGFKVFTPLSLVKQNQTGNIVTLSTYLVVREDSLTLFGFENETERDYFVMLLGVNGIGPRIALSILSSLNVDTIRRAVLQEQADVFSRVSGVGKKNAQKILIYLQGKVSGEAGGVVMPIEESDTSVIEALTALGYSVVEAQTALQSIPKDAPKDVETRLRLALQYFSN